MPAQLISQLLLRHGSSPLVELPPVFLAPALQFPLAGYMSQLSKFSTTSCAASRHINRHRGVSAIHRSGPKQKLSVSKYPLPQPAVPEKPEKRPCNPNHGLWGFFGPDRQAILTPEEEYAHGRAWTIQELRQKSWDDLHCLWWVCAKERNRIATSAYERRRLAAGYGDYESEHREKTVRKTQNAIKHVLRERWYAWTEARELYDKGYRPPKKKELLEDEEDYADDFRKQPDAATSAEKSSD